MEKYSEFRLVNAERNCRETSLFFNKDMIGRVTRIVNYFEIYFAKGYDLNGDINRFLSGTLLTDFLELPSENILRRIQLMSDYVYGTTGVPNLKYNRNSNINHEENIKAFKCIITAKICIFYYSALTQFLSPDVADSRMCDIFYKLIEYYELNDEFDKIIESVNEIEDLSKDDPDYWNKRKEYCLFHAMLTVYDGNAYDKNIIESISETYKMNLRSFDEYQYKNTHCGFAIVNIIKDALLRINYINVPIETKSKMLESMNKILEDEYLEDTYRYINVKAALEYARSRPNNRCQQLVDDNKDKFPYKGIVYHGFIDKNGYRRTAEEIISTYADGFISCSKDLKIAKNFATNFCSDDSCYDDFDRFGGVIEILIDESIECVDIEALLEKEKGDDNRLYSTLYKRYISEREVLVKLPLITFNILRPREVAERLGEIEKQRLINSNPDKMFDSDTLEKYEKNDSGPKLASPF